MTRDILHRDVSESNILINLCNRQALFIDLDMARDLKEPISAHGLEETTSIIPPASPAHDSTISYDLGDDVEHTSYSSQSQPLGKERNLRSSTRSLTEDDHSDGDRHYPATEDGSEQSSAVTDSSEDRNDPDFVPPGGQAVVEPSPPRMIFKPEMLRSGWPDMTVCRSFRISSILMNPRALSILCRCILDTGQFTGGGTTRSHSIGYLFLL